MQCMNKVLPLIYNGYKKYLLLIETYTLVVVDSKPHEPYITVRYVKPKT